MSRSRITQVEVNKRVEMQGLMHMAQGHPSQVPWVLCSWELHLKVMLPLSCRMVSTRSLHSLKSSGAHHLLKKACCLSSEFAVFLLHWNRSQGQALGSCSSPQVIQAGGGCSITVLLSYEAAIEPEGTHQSTGDD